jgi:hypothetical protein
MTPRGVEHKAEFDWALAERLVANLLANVDPGSAMSNYQLAEKAISMVKAGGQADEDGEDGDDDTPTDPGSGMGNDRLKDNVGYGSVIAKDATGTGMAGSPISVGPTAPPTGNRIVVPRQRPLPVYGPSQEEMNEALARQVLAANAAQQGGPDVLPMPTMNGLLGDDPWYGRPRRGPVQTGTGRHSNDGNPDAPVRPGVSVSGPRGDGESTSTVRDRRGAVSQQARQNWERLGIGGLMDDDEGPGTIPETRDL